MLQASFYCPQMEGEVRFICAGRFQLTGRSVMLRLADPPTVQFFSRDRMLSNAPEWKGLCIAICGSCEQTPGDPQQTIEVEHTTWYVVLCRVPECICAFASACTTGYEDNLEPVLRCPLSEFRVLSHRMQNHNSIGMHPIRQLSWREKCV